MDATDALANTVHFKTPQRNERGYHFSWTSAAATPIVLFVDAVSDDVVRDSLWRTLQIVSDWIKVADTKAGAALAVDGAMLAIFTARLRSTPAPTPVSALGLLIALALAAASALFAIWAVVPRARRLGANSMVHYGTIAAYETAASYHTAAVTRFADPDDLTKTLARHIWTMSRSAVRKYRLITKAIQLLVGAMVVGLAGAML